MADLSVLISGASIAGPVAAHFFSKAGAQVTIIERAPSLRQQGQSIDVRGHGVTVLQRMQVLDAVRMQTTREDGLKFVDKNDVVQAFFPAGDGTNENWELTADIEITRGKLAQVLYEATQSSVEYIFGTQISKIEELAYCVRVDFKDGSPTREFDLLVAADGQGSTTRNLAFGKDLPGQIKSLNYWTNYFNIANLKHDDRSFRWYNAVGGRLVLMRPDEEHTRGGLGIMYHNDELRSVLGESTSEQKALWRKLFSDAGWKTERVLQGMDESEDFYMQQVVQVKLDKWSTEGGRVVFVGDAGYCASPISGMGTTLAIVGAYILAGEVSKSPTDLTKAFKSYQKTFRPMVDRAQRLPPGAPAIANPQTAWGITILHTIAGIQTWPGVFKLFKFFDLGNPPASCIPLPDYQISANA